MADFNVRSDSVNVEQLMEQIRGRIREKRGVDYTEDQIRDMANVKLEKFLDPRGVRSDLLDQFRRSRPPYSPPELPNYAFEDHTLFESHRAPLRIIRKLLKPLLKLFFNPNPLIQALNIQSKLNTAYAEREARNESARHTYDALHYEVLHNLVLETTRLGIEVKNLKMKVESLTSRLEFNERRARALESVVVYKPTEERTQTQESRPAREPREQRDHRDQREHRDPRDHRDRGDRRDARGPREQEARPAEGAPPAEPGAPANVTPGPAPQEGPGQRSRRRRRRRGRRGGGSAAALMGGEQQAGVPGTEGTGAALEPQDQADGHDEPDHDDADASQSSDPGATDSEQ